MTTSTAPSADTATPITTAAPVPSQSSTPVLSIVSLVLGIASIVMGLPFIAPIAAVVLGIVAINREPAGKTMAVWGIITGGVILVGMFVGGIVGLALLAPLSGLALSGLFW